MAGLELDGVLDLVGPLDLAAEGGEVTASGHELLLERQPHDATHTDAAPPVVLPPPPASPIDTGTSVWAMASTNHLVTVDGRPVVVLGMVIQGDVPTWPGMVMPSHLNAGVTIGLVPANVAGDHAAVFPSGAVVPLTDSTQGAP